MNNKMISIIIPMYNAEKYIKRCIMSILNQTYKNFEIIIIDDNSLDKSYDICKSIQSKHPNIKLFKNLKNLGVSATRNIGISKTNGEYILFLDSDDYLLTSTLSSLIDGEKLDLKIFGFCYLRNNKIIKIPLPCKEGVYNVNELLRNNLQLLLNVNILHLVTMKLFKTKIIKDNNIKFDNKLICGEDLKFSIEYFKKIKKFKVYEIYNYIYNRDNEQSATRRNIGSISKTLFTNNNNIYHYLKDMNADLRYFNTYTTNIFIYGLVSILKNKNMNLISKYKSINKHFCLNYKNYMKEYIYGKNKCQNRTIKLINKRKKISLILHFKNLDFNMGIKNIYDKI